METPILPPGSHYDHVYEPAEDTFLLMDAIEQDLQSIRKMRPLICLEIGCGSAAVLVAVKKALGKEILCIGTDISEKAGQCSAICASLNHTDIQLILTDLSSAIQDRLCNSIDLLIFNPPYVPTHPHEVPVTGYATISSSWAGGRDGMQVTRRFMQNIPKLLSDTGTFYLLLTMENDVPLVIREMEELGLRAEVSITRRCGREHLSVVTGRKDL